MLVGMLNPKATLSYQDHQQRRNQKQLVHQLMKERRTPVWTTDRMLVWLTDQMLVWTIARRLESQNPLRPPEPALMRLQTQASWIPSKAGQMLVLVLQRLTLKIPLRKERQRLAWRPVQRVWLKVQAGMAVQMSKLA
jgi:hypothetical protein